MEYKVGDKVIVSEGIEYYVVEIKNKYNLFNVGIVFDGIRINDNEIITFKMSDIVANTLKYKDLINEYDEIMNRWDVESGMKSEFEILENENKEKKYLKTWEAIKALEEGFKISVDNCDSFKYLILDENKKIKTDYGKIVYLETIEDKKWYIYEEPKKEIPKEFEGLKYILGSINNMDCDDKDCDKCPLGMDKCDMLDEIFFDMKEKYNF
ncbi:MAG: hypothetical protein ACRCTZ_21905 [Sarcina sp.]